MIEADVPFSQTKPGVRSCSTVYACDAPQLCGSPRVCPTSCADTNRMSSPITSSLVRGARASGLTAAGCTKYRLRSKFITLCYQPMWLLMMYPERGSVTCGPYAYMISEGKYLMIDYRTST